MYYHYIHKFKNGFKFTFENRNEIYDRFLKWCIIHQLLDGKYYEYLPEEEVLNREDIKFIREV